MRLINTETLEMHEFLPADIPRYAILSHRWQEEEVSFKQYSKRHKYPEIQQLKGFTKIEQLCRIARERQMKWAWIDTCCIDSRSSAELSEAINSMWRWYKDAAECHVYLCDVHMQDHFSDVLAQVENSGWFTRAWTLQELIAPRRRFFFTSAWLQIGLIEFDTTLILGLMESDSSSLEGSSGSLLLAMSRASKVPLLCLLGYSVGFFAIGERLSWSANRGASRPEDVAYSLMGLLDVNMPLLYGEGEEKAFTRLQLELLKKSDDTSLFAWRFPRDTGQPNPRASRGLLASSPAQFASSGRNQKTNDDYWSFSLVGGAFSTAPYEMTNQGLHLHLPAYQIQTLDAERVLWCVPLSMKGGAIFLDHSACVDPQSSPVSATRTSFSDFNLNGMFHIEGAKRAISLKEDLDADRSFVYLAEDQRGELKLCEFYVVQDHL